MIPDFDIDNVRASVSMAQVASMYGYRVNRSGFIKCPFHSDHSPSMKIYDGNRGYYCFVCHQGGDIFDFVMKHDGLQFDAAVRHIAAVFGIATSDGKSELSPEDKRRMAEQRAKREAAEEARKANQNRLTQIGQELCRLRDMQGEFEPLGAVWCGFQKKIESLECEWEARFAAEDTREADGR